LAIVLERDALRAALQAGAGKGVRVAMLDTGVDESHPELSGKIAASYELARTGSGFACTRVEGFDAVGHGTACAGIIMRLAPDVELHSVKVIGPSARGSSVELAYGLEWALENKMNVINASLGTLDWRNKDRLAELAEHAFYEGITVVAAANNRGQTAYPANLPTVLAVDSGAFEDPLSFHYRLGTYIELEANGIYVEAPSPGGETKLFTGTSFACPHITGIVARLLSVHPGLQPFEIRTMLWRLVQQ
jgi:subtilisin